MVDQTESTGMVAIRGPRVIERVSGVLPVDVKAMKRYQFESGNYMGMLKFTVFRSGYTGEDGVEIIIPGKVAPMAMKLLGGKMDKEEATIKPAGLGARDTLRLEAGLPLHGHELGPGITPLQAGLGWVVGWSKGDFRGRGPLEAERARGVARLLRGLTVDGRQPPRTGSEVLAGGTVVGHVTSGNFSPVLGHGIALGFVPPTLEPGAAVAIDVRGKHLPGRVVRTPFVTAS